MHKTSLKKRRFAQKRNNYYSSMLVENLQNKIQSDNNCPRFIRTPKRSFLYTLCKNIKYANVFVFMNMLKYAYVC